MKRPRFAPLAPRIPTAPMADIAFLLIIFFMLTTSFSPEKTAVKLPESQIRTELSKDAAIIAISLKGELSFSDGEQPGFPLATYSDIGPLVEGMIKIVPEKEFLIKADRGVRYEMVDSVLEQLRNSGARRIGLLTDRKVVREI